MAFISTTMALDDSLLGKGQEQGMNGSSSGLSSNISILNPPATLNVNDAQFDKGVRVGSLIAIIALGIAGCLGVFGWIWYNRGRKSRVTILILHLNASDTLVLLGTVATQLIWELSDRNWALGNVVCKLYKYFQAFTIMASSNMLIALSVDRHQAIRAPLREPFAVSTIIMIE